MKKAIIKSWQTTLAGVGQFIAVLGGAVEAQFDGLPETVPQWSAVAASLVIMLGMFMARDATDA